MARATKQQFDEKKLKELVLYIAHCSQDDPAFGATKLNKLLYFSDFQAYGALERSITGSTYQRLDHGPAPRELLAAIRALEREGRAKFAEGTYLGFPQKRLTALDEPMLEAFSPAEREIVDEVLDRLRLLNASEVSELSHLDVGWRTAGEREEIPYGTALISNRWPSPRERGISARLVERTARRTGGSRQLRTVVRTPAFDADAAAIAGDVRRIDEALDALVRAIARDPLIFAEIPELGRRVAFTVPFPGVPECVVLFTVDSDEQCTLREIGSVEPRYEEED